MKQFSGTVGAALVASCFVLSVGCPPVGRDPVAGQTRTFDGIEFQWCPAGTFAMGSPSSEAGRAIDETLHAVTIAKGFWLGKFEVTQAQWEDIRNTNPSFFEGNDRPVETVSWNDVQEYLVTFNATHSGATYRLPTEAEWEYACRAGSTSRFYWGEDSNETAIANYAWYNANSSNKTHIVGTKSPNEWGLFDMSGNVHEWCQDEYGDYPAGPVTDPMGAIPGDSAVYRGGAWHLDQPYFCRSAARYYDLPNLKYNYIGFRLLRTEN